MCVLFEKMVLNHPDTIQAQPFHKLHLLKRIAVKRMLGVRRPRTGQLKLKENTKFHVPSLSKSSHTPILSRGPSRSLCGEAKEQDSGSIGVGRCQNMVLAEVCDCVLERGRFSLCLAE